MKQIIKVYLDRYNRIKLEFLQLPKNYHLKFFYKQLNCQYIDIITRKIGGLYFDLIIDDEGKNNNKEITAIMIDKDYYVLDELAGSFLITSHNEKGETIPLNEEQQQHILNTIQTTIMRQKEFTINEFVVLEY